MFIKKRIAIFALHIKRQQRIQPGSKKSTADVLYFRTKADAIQYQQAHYKNNESAIKELDAIEDGTTIKHFHYKPSAARHTFGAYILDDHLRMEILKLNEWVLVGLNRPYPNKRIAGSPSNYKEVKHFIWAGKQKNDLVVKDAKLLAKPIIFTDQRALKES